MCRKAIEHGGHVLIARNVDHASFEFRLQHICFGKSEDLPCGNKSSHMELMESRPSYCSNWYGPKMVKHTLLKSVPHSYHLTCSVKFSFTISNLDDQPVGSDQSQTVKKDHFDRKVQHTPFPDHRQVHHCSDTYGCRDGLRLSAKVTLPRDGFGLRRKRLSSLDLVFGRGIRCFICLFIVWGEVWRRSSSACGVDCVCRGLTFPGSAMPGQGGVSSWRVVSRYRREHVYRAVLVGQTELASRSAPERCVGIGGTLIPYSSDQISEPGKGYSPHTHRMLLSVVVSPELYQMGGTANL
ncbi:hypothetical protein BKA67DRAFT_538384 [Truncatella angustata]|uniref:Uncharacterized protein n=1 Tax=Truncatella angustata TaxID=152316 RepID=A0A9P8UEA6_9PEZI|nr:uncharacterized protein BKA67DRAFT_538384 [Truncatella angustata]KAH6648340.1 hypothetical protein BKA67DRAFT_538384 [Truncatella angustata]